METTIVKWGNSQGIRLPKAFLQNLQLAENDPVEVTLENEKIIIAKIVAKGHKSTKQRLAQFYGDEYASIDLPNKEAPWGNPVGNEIW